MTTDQLAQILKDRYTNAGRGLTVTSVHLFGIEFADALKGHPLKEICAHANVPVSYHTEIHKGMKLSPFVILKP
ncbi:hypothetical protein SDC9_19984 [bioreactor metagenome]|uniref:HTH-like domain-containing protein n=1 Tax=bioreactor metagenome TaxID=1076179 RepID=A0A644U5H0_9ZZZZ